MVSPIVCVLKGRNRQNGVRLCCDYRYLMKDTKGDAVKFWEDQAFNQHSVTLPYGFVVCGGLEKVYFCNMFVWRKWPVA